MYYLSSENKGADQLRVYREADLVFVFAYADCWFSHEVAQIYSDFNLDIILTKSSFFENLNLKDNLKL